MNQQELTQKLAISGGQVTLSVATLTPAMDAFLAAYNAGQPIVISGAATQAGAGGALVVTGQSSFLGVPNLPVMATFSVDAAGEVHAILRYQLRDSAPGPAAWTFSKSFPGLPSVVDYDTPLPANFDPRTFDINAGQKPFLDALVLFDTAAVLTTAAGTDPVLDVPLVPGINFVSRMRPQGMLGVLESVLGTDPTLLLYGAVLLPKPTDRTTPLQPLEHPWDRMAAGSQLEPAPGIYLQAALDAHFQLGKVIFHDALFHVYSPVSDDAMAKNPSFQPLHGYTGTLDIPSAGVSVALGADMQWNLPQALLYGKVAGVTLGKLAHLADAAGTGDLLSHLPSELQKAVDGLDKLALMYVALDLGESGGAPAVRGVYITVGFPDLQWKVWKDDLVVESLSCRFAVRDPFGASSPASSGPSFSVTVCGTVDIAGEPLDVQASSDRGFTIWAATRKPLAIPLDKLMKAHAPGLPVPGALTINSLSAVVAPGAYYSMSALVAGTPDPWVIPIGKDKLTISDIVLNFEVPASGSAAGSFAGRIAFGQGLVLRMAYDIPGNFFIRGDLPPMQLGQVIDKLCDRPVKLPKGFDVALDYSSIVIQEQNGNFLFQLAADVKNLGMLAFEARSAAGGWGFAMGVDLGGTGLSSVPGLGALASFEKAFHLQKLLLVVSSIDQPGFQLPDTAQFQSPTLATKKVALPASASGVTAGLNVFGQWTLDASDKHQKLLGTLLGKGTTLDVVLQVGEDPAASSRLLATLQSKLAGHPASCEVGVQITGGAPSLFFTASFTVDIQKTQQTFDATALIVPNGFFLSADMKGGGTVDFGPFRVGNLALEMGVDFEGLPSLGLAGTLDVGSFDSSLAVFFDAANPAQSMVAGAVSNLTLADVAASLLGGAIKSPIDDVLKTVAIRGTQQFPIAASLGADLDQRKLDGVAAAFASAGKVQIPSTAAQTLLVVKKPGQAWALTDLTTMRHYQLSLQGQSIVVSLEAQLYFAPQATSIATTTFPQGFYLDGAIELFGYHAQATVTVQASKGISVDAQMDKLVLVDPSLFCLAAAQGGGGPKVSISTFNQPSQPTPELRAPHFYVNGSLHLLGLQATVLANVSTKGMQVELKGTLVPGVQLDLDVLYGAGSLSVDGDLEMGLGVIDLGPLGKIHVNTDLEGSLGVRADSKQIAAAVEASFDLFGEHKSIDKFTLDAKADALTHLADTLGDKVKKLLLDEFKDAGKWADAMKKGAVEGVDDSEKVLKSVFGKSDKDAKAAAADIKGGAKTAEKAVTKTASDFGKKLKKLF
jgi:hypothetical protein